MLKDLRDKFYFAEDGGDNGGGTGDIVSGATITGDGNTGGSGSDPAKQIQHVAASYANDLEEALRGDDFTGIEDVGKLYKAYKSNKDELSKSLKIPGKDASVDELKAFFTKIGMPDKPEDYGLSDFDLDKNEIASMKKNFMETAHKSCLTKQQAENLWKHEAATYTAYKQTAAKQVEELTNNFDQRYDNALKDEYPDSTRRAERIKTERNLFNEFVGKAGLGTYFKRTGLSLNPYFIHAMSTFYEKYASGDVPGREPKGITEGERLRQLYPSMFKGEK